MFLRSVDHSVRSRQHVGWNRQAELLRCFHISPPESGKPYSGVSRVGGFVPPALEFSFVKFDGRTRRSHESANTLDNDSDCALDIRISTLSGLWKNRASSMGQQRNHIGREVIRESGTILLESRKKFLVLVAFLADKADFFVSNLLITTPRFPKNKASYSGMLLAQDMGPKAIETVNFNRGLYGRCCRNPT